MRIFNKEKTKELKNVDETKGELFDDKLFLRHIDKVEEQGHFETIKEYKNGGKDVLWVVDVKGVEEHDEFEDIKIFVPFSKQKLLKMQIDEIKFWFDVVYAKDEQKLRRLVSLNLKTDDGKNPEEELHALYEKAEEKRKQIQNLSKEI